MVTKIFNWSNLNLLFFLFLFAGIGNATNYYVSTTGDNSKLGLTEDTAWRTITYSATKATTGDTVNIKAGNYGHEHVIMSNSGTSSNLIIFQGYGGIVEINGADRIGYGIYINTKSYIQIKNINITLYGEGVRVQSSNYITLDNITATNFGKTEWGFDGWGIRVQASNYCTIRNCNVTDGRAVDFWFDHSNYNLIENCNAYGIETADATDYYIVLLYSHDNTVRNCISRNMHPLIGAHPGHGIGIKDAYWETGYSSPHSYNNKFIDCKTIDNGESFYASHYAYNNEFINCTSVSSNLYVTYWNYGIIVRDGAHHNTFKNFKTLGGHRMDLAILDSDESPGVATPTDNLFLNCIFNNIDGKAPSLNAMSLVQSSNAEFRNCVFTRTGSAIGFFEYPGSNTKFNNCIITGFSTFNSGVSVNYSNFWNNGFTTPSGTQNIKANPLFANPANNDFHLQSEYGRWTPIGWDTSDTKTSPCIGAGDPTSDNTKSPCGGTIEMGAYGNTTEASLTRAGCIPTVVRMSLEPRALSGIKLTVKGSLLKIDGLSKGASGAIFDVRGAIVSKISGTNADDGSVSMRLFSAGVYFVKLNERGKGPTGKVYPVFMR